LFSKIHLTLSLCPKKFQGKTDIDQEKIPGSQGFQRHWKEIEQSNGLVSAGLEQLFGQRTNEDRSGYRRSIKTTDVGSVKA